MLSIFPKAHISTIIVSCQYRLLVMPPTYPAVDNEDASFSLAEKLAAFHIDELISSEVKDARPAVISERLPDWTSSSNTTDLVNWHLFEDQSGSSSEARPDARGHVPPHPFQYLLEPTPQQDDEPNGTRPSNSIAPSAGPGVPQWSKDGNRSTPPDPLGVLMDEVFPVDPVCGDGIAVGGSCSNSTNASYTGPHLHDNSDTDHRPVIPAREESRSGYKYSRPAPIWATVTDPVERRRIQNGIAQRAFSKS